MVTHPLATASVLFLRRHDWECLALRLWWVLWKLLGNLHKESLDVVGILGGCTKADELVVARARKRVVVVNLIIVIIW